MPQANKKAPAGRKATAKRPPLINAVDFARRGSRGRRAPVTTRDDVRTSNFRGRSCVGTTYRAHGEAIDLFPLAR